MNRQSLDERLRGIGWTVTQSGCWEWKGPRNKAGYGVFNARALGHERTPAHRVMYEHLVGPIPEGLLVRHHCDNPPCVNPEHLAPGTYADNTRDRVERGRKGGGRRAPDEARVGEAATLASQGKSVTEIAELLGISRRTIQRWGIGSPIAGRPRLPEGEGSRWTQRRRRHEAQSEGRLPADRDPAALRAREREMRAAGTPAVEIAAALGVRPETISRWRRAERAESEGGESRPSS